ncbi:Ger(x)C family spore germination protein [Jeotgalibacillus haloalkalitolerans]|uniref:Ger(X)C family spore germination protein n=1 Tax=Jeotgalibacillus haloalkalitolerans TaxID=3104292 RepID=A0ABU5KIL8_9BACL|nr:Ger(x)C family spore germination protein [Jeotgalibacillus sp. HH7-29]MDZ5711010.1 Ger(x)C family spore germination protein [Jeotgalibacillus sp. HH7-29]
MKKKPIILMILSSLMLSGCWDQNLLKDVQLVYTAGYDQTDNGEVKATTLAPPIDQTDQVNEITVTGHTMRDSMLEMDLLIAEFADFSKLQTILLGNDLVTQEIYSFLDELYRNPQYNLHARVAVTDRPANELLSQQIETQKDKSEYFKGLLESSELTSVTPYVSLQDACTIMFNPERDLYLPYIAYEEKEKRAKLAGIALFHKNRFTGAYLDPEESVIFNMLNNDTGETVRVTRRVHDDRELEVENWLTAEIKHSKTRMKVSKDLKTWEAKVEMEIVITEYGQNKITKEKEADLTKRLKEILTEDIMHVMAKLQSSQSDAFGLANRVAAFNDERWDPDSWDETYKALQIHAEIELKVMGTGIID